MSKFILFVLSMIIPFVASARDGEIFKAKTVEGVEMTFMVISEVEKTCEVYGKYANRCIASDTEGPITIPEQAKDYYVISIGDRAFADCSQLTAIDIPEKLTHIGGYAFSGCI